MNDNRHFIGLDVGADELTACSINAAGEIMNEASLPSSWEHVAKFVDDNIGKEFAAIGLEAGSTGTLIARRLRENGYTVHVFETRQASKFLKIRQNKTDMNDARGLADIVRLGIGVVTEVFLKSPEFQQLRTKLTLRQKLVRHRVAGEGAINSVFRLNGGRLVNSRSATGLRRHVNDELDRLRYVQGVDLRRDILPVLKICLATRDYLEKLDRELTKIAETNAVCTRFMEIPGVGPISALSFYSAIEDPKRFPKNEDVGAYLGLVPRIKQSGRVLQHHRISKMGNTMTRAHLTMAAGTMMRQTTIECAMRTWALGLSARVGRAKAKTALARKLAVVMVSMWKHDMPFSTKGADSSQPVQMDRTAAIDAATYRAHAPEGAF